MNQPSHLAPSKPNNHRDPSRPGTHREHLVVYAVVGVRLEVAAAVAGGRGGRHGLRLALVLVKPQDLVHRAAHRGHVCGSAGSVGQPGHILINHGHGWVIKC